MSINYQFKRIPDKLHPSLKAWNAADELLVQQLEDNVTGLAIYNDTFGYLSCYLAEGNPCIITDLSSQRKAIKLNLKSNGKTIDDTHFYSLTDTISTPIRSVLLKIPKSLNLFEFYLQKIHQSILDDGIVYCGFMTKYFSKGLLKIAEKYFKTVAQSKAEKKARVLILSGKKNVNDYENIEHFTYRNISIQQYKGVFSARKIDAATDFLLNHLGIPEERKHILDLACGNGIIGRWILEKIKPESIRFIDDSRLAVESAKMNIQYSGAIFDQNYCLKNIPDNSLDWIVTNPPFHFGHTVDIEIPLTLFKEACSKLKLNGVLTIVANSNLGYEKTLNQLFKQVVILNSNRQYKIYECRK